MKGRDYILVYMKKFQLLQIYLESSFLNKWCQLPCMVSGFVEKSYKNMLCLGCPKAQWKNAAFR